MSITAGSTGAQVNQTLYSLLSSADQTGIQLCIDSVTTRDVEVNMVADAAATTTGTYPALYTRQRYSVRAIYYVPSAAVTANGTNFGTLTVNYGPAAGGTQNPIGTLNTSTVNLTALSANALTLTPANLLVPLNSVISVVETKSGTGVSFPQGTIVLQLDIA